MSTTLSSIRIAVKMVSRQFVQVEIAVLDMVQEVDGSKIANRRLIARCVQQNLGAQVAAMDHPLVILWRTNVGRIP